MREILFRGKRHDKGWIYGSLLKVTYDGNTYNLIFADNFLFVFGEATAMEHAAVDPSTVSQFTGLTDKNGKKIFEGDIVDCWSEGVNAKGTVQQRKDGLWIIYPAWQKTIMWGLCPDEYCNTTVEVIGNIHDNPELLGGAEDG